MSQPFYVYIGEGTYTSRTNLCPDPTFAYNPMVTTLRARFWSSTVTPSWDATYSYFGDHSLRLEASTSQVTTYGASDWYNGYAIPVEEGYDYTASMWVRSDQTASYAIGIYYYDAVQYGGNLDYDVSSTTQVTGGIWTRLSFTFTAPTGALGGKFFLRKSGTASAVGTNIDGVLFEKAASAGDFFDGNITPDLAPPVTYLESHWNGYPSESSSTMTFETKNTATNALSIDLSAGRRTNLDLCTAGRCMIELLDPASIPDLDELVEVFYDETRLFTGYVYDTEMQYSMTSGLDVLKVSAETYLAKAGRAEISVDEATDGNIITLADVAATSVGLVVDTEPTTGLTASHNAYQGNLLSYLQRLQTTSFGLLADDRDSLRVVTRDSGPSPQRGGGFTDETPNDDLVVYSGLRFGSKQESYYSLVRIEPEATGISAAQSGSGNRALVLQTYSPSSNAAQDLADYILDVYSDTSVGPREILIDVAAQPNSTWASILNLDTYPSETTKARGAIFQKQRVTFRSQTYGMVIEGYTLTATPDAARVTFYLSPAPNFPYLILNDTDFGVLDTAQLGLG